MKMNKRFWSGVAAIVCVASLGISAFAAADNKAVGDVGTAYVNVPSRASASASTSADETGSSSSDYVAVGFNAYTFGGTIYEPSSTNASVTFEGETYPIKKNSGANYTNADCWVTNGMSIEYVNSYHAIRRAGTVYSTTIIGTESN